MKAIVYSRYGGPEVLSVAEIAKPSPKDDEVLIRVRAAALNPLDWHFVRGAPFLVRLMTGLRKPRSSQLGVDVAGEVEAVGKNVTSFKPGDAVFGSCRGTFAVQIAKAFGTTVTGVCSSGNVELVRAIGADRVIDYTQDDFTRGAERYDVILDLIGNHPLRACKRLLNPGGVVVVVGAQRVPRMLSNLLQALLTKKVTTFVAKSTKEDLTTLRELMESGKVEPVIDRTYALNEVGEAIRYVEKGHARGKVVIALK